MTAIGLVITIALLARGHRAAILIGIVATTVIAIILEKMLNTGQFGPGQAQVPTQWIDTPDFSLVGQFSFRFFSHMGIGVAILTILAIMMADFFDTMGTMVGVGSQAGYLNENGELPDAQKPLLVDSVAAMAGGMVSSSSARRISSRRQALATADAAAWFRLSSVSSSCWRCHLRRWLVSFRPRQRRRR